MLVDISATSMATYQGSSQRVNRVSSQLGDDMVAVLFAVIVIVFHDAKCDLGKVEFSNHGVTDCTLLASY